MRISALKKCFCNLRDRVIALENKIDVDTDEQTISLAGNTITLSAGVTGGGGTIDLTPYLDNTDSQVLSASVVGTDLVLSISGGNTVNVPLSSLGSDDQLLALAGNTLSIEDGNSVDLSPYLDNTDSQTLTPTVVAGETTAITISGGNTIPILHPPVVIPPLTLTTEQIFHEKFFARSSNATTQTASRNLTMVRTSVGRWTVTLGMAHTNGVNFHPSITAEEQAGNRDTPDITVVQGTQNNSTTFDIQITTGDNGGVADTYVDTPFSIGIDDAITVVTNVTQ